MISMRFGLSMTTVTLLLFQGLVHAEDVSVVYRPLDAALVKTLFTVSFVKDGKIALKDEKAPNCNGGSCVVTSYTPYHLAPGSYDVRVEGEGAVTVVKNGIAVVAGQKREVISDLRAGKGVKITEYATGGLSREELATRMKKLEDTVEVLKNKK
jgi:hypothetical protein